MCVVRVLCVVACSCCLLFVVGWQLLSLVVVGVRCVLLFVVVWCWCCVVVIGCLVSCVLFAGARCFVFVACWRCVMRVDVCCCRLFGVVVRCWLFLFGVVGVCWWWCTALCVVGCLLLGVCDVFVVVDCCSLFVVRRASSLVFVVGHCVSCVVRCLLAVVCCFGVWWLLLCIV